MALVNVVNVDVLDNPTCFLNPFQFEITFECLQELDDDLEWKVLYVGSALDTRLDQILDEILVGPVPVGMNKFVLQADGPDVAKLPPDDILGVTVVLVTCSYREKEFVRVGYYVNNEYTGIYDEEACQGNPQNDPNFDIKLIQRQILADKPRVTKFPISWGKEDDKNNTNNQNNTENGVNDENAGSNGMMMTLEEQREIELEIAAKGYNNEEMVKQYYNENDEDDDDEEENQNDDAEVDIDDAEEDEADVDRSMIGEQSLTEIDMEVE